MFVYYGIKKLTIILYKLQHVCTGDLYSAIIPNNDIRTLIHMVESKNVCKASQANHDTSVTKQLQAYGCKVCPSVVMKQVTNI